jgi:Transposase DDE domain
VGSNRRIPRHKVFAGLAARGQCSLGWFYGFKLHLVINEYGEVLAFTLTAVRAKMKNRLMLMRDKLLLRKRYIIETSNDQLKNQSQIEHSRHRSPINFVLNVVAGLIAYLRQPKKPAINGSHQHVKALALLQ